MVLRPPPGPAARDAAARGGERSLAGHARRDARTLRHRAAGEPRGRDVGWAQDAAEAIGFPVALKIRSPDILHKTEAGGVRLDLRSRAEVAGAAAALIAAARATHKGARIEGLLVQQMACGVEAIVGARSDALYGPLLLIGAGGVLVELARDVALRLLPVAAPDVGAMIDGLRLNQLLAGYRGRAAADRSALERTALALARFYLDHRSRIADIEINPLMVGPAGAIAVDVRVLWRAAT